LNSEADVFKIRFVRIFDTDLAADFSLYKLPSLVYFRNGIPVVYEGDLRDEAEVLEWLIQHQTSIDEEDVVEKASKVYPFIRLLFFENFSLHKMEQEIR